MYEDLKVIFLDEVSMCGTDKLTTIHYKMQEIMDNQKFMGGVSVVCTGDFGQLPPAGNEGMIWKKSYIDGRSDASPNHWDDHFTIFYLTQKMRSQDNEFSEISDKVRKGHCDSSVLEYMMSHVRDCPSEFENKKFADGKLSIIVTTNADREKINSEKLEQLLPLEKAYNISARDESTNMRNPPKVPKSSPLTKTGQLENEILIKKGAPVMLTSNHRQQRYKNNGMVNGSRGYVDSIQISKTNPEEIEVIWVVFHGENTGKLLREENKALLKFHKPDNPLAVPIKKQKKQFRMQGLKGSVFVLREQFPLTLCYAITSHKSQGQTLEEVLIDFSTTNFIPNGSFYTAMSRVRQGSSLYLRDFQKHYITTETTVEEKLAGMKLTKPYQFKKFLLDKQIFEIEGKEIKIGYININNLHDAMSAKFINEDENLLNLDLLLIADTRLTSQDSEESVMDQLNNWKISIRADSPDNIGHMGMLLIQSKKSSLLGKMKLDFFLKQWSNSKKIIHSQLLTVTIKNNNKKVSFMYVRETPTVQLLERLMKEFQSSDLVMGDFNLDPSREADKSKLQMIEKCGYRRVLNEITTTRINQLDHIFLDLQVTEFFSTCYNNYTSDHKVIAIRLPLGSNKISEEFKQEFYYHQGKQSNQVEHELVSVTNCGSQEERQPSVSSSAPTKRKHNAPNITSKRTRVEFRCIRNQDNESCWLNSCLQMMLTVLDYSSAINQNDSSTLFTLLKQYQTQEFHTALDPKALRDLLFETEMERIVGEQIVPNNRLFHYFGTSTTNFRHLKEITERSRIGQQDCKDFFICIQQNSFYWPDVYELMKFHVLEYSQCCGCGFQSRSNVPTLHSYLIFDPPTEDCSLMDVLNVNINNPNIRENWRDENGCGEKNNCLKFTRLEPGSDIEFLTLIVSRLQNDEYGNPVINTKRVTANTMVSVKTATDEDLTFKPVAVIHHIGHIIGNETRGHFMSDLLDVRTNQWIRTSDDADPKLLSEPTDKGYIFLLKRHRV